LLLRLLLACDMMQNLFWCWFNRMLSFCKCTGPEQKPMNLWVVRKKKMQPLEFHKTKILLWEKCSHTALPLVGVQAAVFDCCMLIWQNRTKTCCCCIIVCDLHRVHNCSATSVNFHTGTCHEPCLHTVHLSFDAQSCGGCSLFSSVVISIPIWFCANTQNSSNGAIRHPNRMFTKRILNCCASQKWSSTC